MAPEQFGALVKTEIAKGRRWSKHPAPRPIDKQAANDGAKTMIQGRVRGVPYPRNKKRGNTKAAPAWTDAVTAQTRHLPKVTGPCHLKVTFRLPANKFPKDHPYGSDLDNLLKRFCDALQRTIFSEVPGGDGCIVGIRARKVRVSRDQEVGADFKIVSSRAP